MAKVSETKQKLLDISLQLMMSKGYNATSIEEICKLAEVTKGGFFYYFKSKEILGTTVLDYYWETRQRQFADADWMNADNPLEQIHGFLMTVADVFMNDANGYSCLAGCFSQELATTNATFQARISAIFSEWAEQIKPVLQMVIESGSMRHDVDVDLLADHIIAVTQGALVVALARQDRSVIKQQLTMLNLHLQSLYTT